IEVRVAFVDAHRQEFGVEFICKQLQVAPSSYYAAKKRLIAPSARAVRDVLMMQVLFTLWIANRKGYGAHKLWKAAARARQDAGGSRAPDLVNRQFKARRPDALWVTDLTYVATRSGMAYVCFIVDAFSRRIVGWRVAANMKTEMVLDALEMARACRGNHRLIGLVTHSDAGSQGGFNRSSQHLDQEVARWPTGLGSRRFVRIGGRSPRRADRRSLGVRIGSGSGQRSRAV